MSSQRHATRQSKESRRSEKSLASTRYSQESRRSGGYPASDASSRRSYAESRRSAEGNGVPMMPLSARGPRRSADEYSECSGSAAPLSARGSRRSEAEYSQCSGSQSARGPPKSRYSDESYVSYRSGSRYSEVSEAESASYSQASYNTCKADEFFDVVGSPRPHMLGFTFKKRPENGFGRTTYGGFTLREVPPPLKNPDYLLAYRGCHPDAKYYAEPNQPGPGFRRTACGNFWRR